MNWLEKYKIAKENSKNKRLEEYKEELLEFKEKVKKALEKGEDAIALCDTLRTGTNVAIKLGFNIEYCGYGNIIFFNKKGIKKLQKELEKYNLESEVN